MPASLLSKRFGAVVRKSRIRAGLSQEEFSELAQVHPTYVSMVERGVRNPTLDVADRMAKALKTSLPKLLDQAQKESGDAS